MSAGSRGGSCGRQRITQIPRRASERSGGDAMQVRHGMSETVLTVGPGHTLRAVSRLMSQRAVGAAVVIDPDGNGPGIITERDVLSSIGSGQDPDAELV